MEDSKIRIARKCRSALAATTLLYALLVATHLGEFWPYSIWPMFSQAGNEWSKSLVREVEADGCPSDWSRIGEDELPGEPFALERIGLDQNDLANLLERGSRQPEEPLPVVRRYFEGATDRTVLIVYLAEGSLAGERRKELRIDYTPFYCLFPDTARVNPELLQP